MKTPIPQNLDQMRSDIQIAEANLLAKTSAYNCAYVDWVTKENVDDAVLTVSQAALICDRKESTLRNIISKTPELKSGTRGRKDSCTLTYAEVKEHILPRKRGRELSEARKKIILLLRETTEMNADEIAKEMRVSISSVEKVLKSTEATEPAEAA